MESSKKSSILRSTSWAIALFLLVMTMVYLLHGGELRVKDHSVRFEIGDLKTAKEEKALDGIQEIQLDLQDAEVVIQYAEDQRMHIKEATNDPEKDHLFNVKASGNKIVVERGKLSGKLFQLGDQKEHMVEVAIPKSYQENLLIHTTSGNIDFKEDWRLKTLKVQSASGDIQCKGAIYAKEVKISTASGFQDLDKIEAKEISLGSASGEIECKQSIKAEQFKCDTASGSQHFEQIQAEKYALEAASGDIEVSQLIGGGKTQSISGNIILSKIQLKDDFKAKSTSGDVELEFSRESNAKVKVSTTSGDIDGNVKLENKDVAGKNTEGLMGHESEYKVKVETTSGNVKINQE